MKRSKLIAAVIITSLASILSLMAFTGCPTPTETTTPTATPTKPIELKLNTLFPPECTQVKYQILPWIDELEKRTEGRVKIVPYYLSSLAPIDQAYNAAVSGLADISEVDLSVHSGLFPMYDVVQQPPPSNKYARVAHIIRLLEGAFPQMREEFSKVKYLFTWTIGDPHIHSRTKLIQTVEDLKGMKLGSSSNYTLQRANHLGASAAAVNPADVYQDLDRGVIDGLMFVSDSLIAWRLTEVVDYHIYVAMGHAAFVMTMNWDKWNSLPPDIQQIFDEVSEWAPDAFDQAGFENEKIAISFGEEEGVETIYLSSEEYARWDALVKPLQDDFAANLEAKGLPGRNLLDRYLQLLKENQMYK